MSTTETSPGASTATPRAGTIDMKLEVISIPVSDVDRSKSFYESLGWRLDADFDPGNGVRVVQFTPTHSECSIGFGSGGVLKAEPGSIERMELVVSDIEAAREDLIGRGVEVSDFFHRDESGFQPGLHPERQSYSSYATFSDPDGNGFILQEVTERLPGRTWDD
jgi:catechol 2,3-dioxygenase-like lactoylglutathione lyase family enzyme